MVSLAGKEICSLSLFDEGGFLLVLMIGKERCRLSLFDEGTVLPSFDGGGILSFLGEDET